MNGFEPAFALLRGFHFADEGSRTNALWLALWLRMAAETSTAFRPPMVVIEGPYRGLLARQLCKAAKVRYLSNAEWPPRMDELMLGVLDGCRAVTFGRTRSVRNVRGGYHTPSEGFARFLTAPSQAIRRLGKQEMIERPVSMVSILAVDGVRLSADLQRRAVFIRLKNPPRAKAKKAGKTTTPRKG